MQWLAALGAGAFIAASGLVGVRLLALARRTHALPELAIGTALLAGGCLGYCLIVLALVARAFSPLGNAVSLIAGVFCTTVGVAALALGAWWIFRPADAWGRALFVAIAATVSASCLARLADPMTVPPHPAIFWSNALASAAAYAWSAVESLAYGRRMQRRARIGLAEPILVARFHLWGAAAAAAAAIHVAAMGNRALGAAGIHPAILAAQSLLGIAAAGCVAAAFFPPRALRRRVAAALGLAQA